MTPKEKARKLVNKYMFYFPEFRNEKEYDYDEDKAKECALIAVRELIDQCWDYREIDLEKSCDYWKEVKQEIEKL